MHSLHVEGSSGPGHVEVVTRGEWAAWALKATPSSRRAATDPAMLASSSFLSTMCDGELLKKSSVKDTAWI